MKEFTVGPEAAGQRLDVFVAAQYPQFTRSSLLSLFKNRLVSVSGEPQKAGYKLKSTDSVKVDQEMLL
jgi:23S rRNA-/tRNA-specific pseudouridylate synthase